MVTPTARRLSHGLWRPRSTTDGDAPPGRVDIVTGMFLDIVHSVLEGARFGALLAAFPKEARAELRAFRENLARELRTFTNWPVRSGTLKEARANMVAVYSGDLQHGSALSGVNLFRGRIAGGSLTGCNAALATVEDGEARLVNVLIGSVHGGRIRVVNVIAADVFGGDIDTCGVLVGNVFGGRARVGLLVGDVMGGDVRAARHVGNKRF